MTCAGISVLALILNVLVDVVSSSYTLWLERSNNSISSDFEETENNLFDGQNQADRAPKPTEGTGGNFQQKGAQEIVANPSKGQEAQKVSSRCCGSSRNSQIPKVDSTFDSQITVSTTCPRNCYGTPWRGAAFPDCSYRGLTSKTIITIEIGSFVSCHLTSYFGRKQRNTISYASMKTPTFAQFTRSALQ